MARAKNGPARKASRPAGKTGRPHRGWRLIAALTVVGGLGVAAARVPVGGRTLLERGRDGLPWRSLSQRARAEVDRLTKGDAAQERQRSVPAHPQSVRPRAVPTERLTRSDRAALNRLIP